MSTAIRASFLTSDRSETAQQAHSVPAKIPFLAASSSLQEKLAESTTPKRIQAQLLVFLLILSIGLIRHYLCPHTTKRSIHHHADDLKEENIAQVHSILVYPIKSCAAVELDAAQLTRKGSELDRKWMIVTRHERMADGSYQEQQQKGWQKVALRQDSRLTLVVPFIDEEDNLLRLSISPHAQSADDFGTIAMPLRPTREQMESWKLLPKVEMWGDHADGRIVQSASSSSPSPSDWLSRFLGYPVELIYFDYHSDVHRSAFPIYKPPSDIASWSGKAKSDLIKPQGIAFADEYPLLVSTVESLHAIEEQIHDAVQASLPGGEGGDGSGGHPIGALNATLWPSSRQLNMIRFRPNIVLRSLSGTEAFRPFSEDSWDQITVVSPPASLSRKKARLAMVARCQRCLLTSVDPITAEKDSSVLLKFLMSRMRTSKTNKPMGSQLGAKVKEGPCFGVYAVPIPCIDEEGLEQGEEGGGDIWERM